MPLSSVPLPPEGSQDWYTHYAAMDDELRNRPPVVFVDRGNYVDATAYATGSIVTYARQRWLAAGNVLTTTPAPGTTSLWIALGTIPDTF
jgi:hypothetical protein